jgi:hypothetical protein
MRSAVHRREDHALRAATGIAVAGALVVLGCGGAPVGPAKPQATPECSVPRLLGFEPGMVVVTRRVLDPATRSSGAEAQQVVVIACRPNEQDDACRARTERAVRAAYPGAESVRAVVERAGEQPGAARRAVVVARSPRRSATAQVLRVELVLAAPADPVDALRALQQRATAEAVTLHSLDRAEGGTLRLEIGCARPFVPAP